MISLVFPSSPPSPRPFPPFPSSSPFCLRPPLPCLFLSLWDSSWSYSAQHRCPTWNNLNLKICLKSHLGKQCLSPLTFIDHVLVLLLVERGLPGALLRLLRGQAGGLAGVNAVLWRKNILFKKELIISLIRTMRFFPSAPKMATDAKATAATNNTFFLISVSRTWATADRNISPFF